MTGIGHAIGPGGLALWAALVSPLAAEGLPGSVEAPSGLWVLHLETLTEEQPFSGERQVVVRLVAPAIAQAGQNTVTMRGDMDWACARWGVPVGQTLSTAPDRIVVEIVSAAVPRGIPLPDTRRFFETYSLQDGVCIWEFF